MSPASPAMPWSAWTFPLVSLVFYGLASAFGAGAAFEPTPLGITFAVLLVPVLFGTVFAAVHHAETIAQRTGEPYGTLVLTVAVTIIEVALIASVMLSGDGGGPTLARDTVFAVVMIVCTGLVGACIAIGGLHYREIGFRVTGASAYLTVLLVLATLTLVLPTYTRSVAGPVYSASQLGFVSVVTLLLYAVFLYIQTVRHREYFIASGTEDPQETGAPASRRKIFVALALLLVALVGVILLAKKFAAVVGAGTTALGLPEGVVGVFVAVLILMPEGVAAARAARQNELQTSLNLALGSSLATIGLTIPTVALASIVMGRSLVLGLEPKETVLLALTLLVSVLTFGTGRTNILYGFVHLVIFATYLFLVFVP